MKDLRVRCESLLHVHIVLCVKCKLCCFGLPVFRHKRHDEIYACKRRLQVGAISMIYFLFGGFVLRVRVMTHNNDYWKINRPWGAFAFHSNSLVMLFHGKFVSFENDNFSVSFGIIRCILYKTVDQVPCSTYNLYHLQFINLQNIFFIIITFLK